MPTFTIVLIISRQLSH